MPDATAALYRAEVRLLEAALVAWRLGEGSGRGGRANNNNGVAAWCGCGRRIRVAASVLDAARSPAGCAAAISKPSARTARNFGARRYGAGSGGACPPAFELIRRPRRWRRRGQGSERLACTACISPALARDVLRECVGPRRKDTAMTQNKDRKQEIRARMAATGEPYTEAARHVGGAAGPPPAADASGELLAWSGPDWYAFPPEPPQGAGLGLGNGRNLRRRAISSAWLRRPGIWTTGLTARSRPRSTWSWSGASTVTARSAPMSSARSGST